MSDQMKHDKDQTIRVMTFNIRHGRGMGNLVNIKRTLAEIVASDANIIGLQEVDRFSLRSGYKDQVKLLAQGLDMYYAFAPCITSGRRQYGNAILSKYPIESVEETTLPSRGEPRKVLQTIIQLKNNNIQVLNTHLSVKTADRRRQMPVLLEVAERLNIPTIAMGDFNMEAKHPLMQTFKRSWCKAEPGQPTFYTGVEIDHIFMSSGIRVIRAWTQPTRASDHHPVIAELRWPMVNLHLSSKMKGDVQP